MAKPKKGRSHHKPLKPLLHQYSACDDLPAAEEFHARIWAKKSGRQWEDLRDWASLLEDIEDMVLTKLDKLESKERR